ncbi:hypothetical protein BOTBODRAFT_470282 [Botryobasidium botryosum FD-172 SS1]|uniref:Large ribosomal subunit protein mL54 n=1 Tax=Botryobasidium botryosum (strain FD-172 SS1) TaxID=930990 RepID=A0A067M8I9_BOTB1|nr:hypothetical protein BOTBODRAFT_470282 [Botryobasidium botryosum FD-172 SS1]
MNALRRSSALFSSFSSSSRQCAPRFYSAKAPESNATSGTASVASSCPENTILTGIAYLKNQTPVVALPDAEYPPWLWTLLTPKQPSADAEAGKRENHKKLRKDNRERIKMSNFMKSQ